MKKIKWWGWLIIAILVIGGIGAMTGGRDKPNQVSDSPTKAAETTGVKKEFFSLGETAELKGVKVTLLEVNESDGQSFVKPDEGHIFVMPKLQIENTSDKQISVSSLMSFDVYIDDVKTSLDLGALVSKEGEQLDGSIDAGKKMLGSIGVQAPTDWKTLEVQFKPTAFSEKFIFKYSKT